MYDQVTDEEDGTSSVQSDKNTDIRVERQKGLVETVGYAIPPRTPLGYIRCLIHRNASLAVIFSSLLHPAGTVKVGCGTRRPCSESSSFVSHPRPSCPPPVLFISFGLCGLIRATADRDLFPDLETMRSPPTCPSRSALTYIRRSAYTVMQVSSSAPIISS